MSGAPDPLAVETFERSKLDWSRLGLPAHAAWLDLYRSLLAIRRREIIPRLAGFTRDHPGVDVRITADIKMVDLERDGMDLALRHGPAALAGPGAIRLFGEKVFPMVVRSSVRFKEAPAAGLSIFDYDPEHDGAKAYTDLARRLIE